MAAYRRPSTDADRAKEAAAREETLQRLHDQLKDGVDSIRNGDDWKQWLAFSSSFTRYSFRNLMLIYTQRPAATLVAAYRSWQQKGRQVRRGETGIKILAPVTRREQLVDTNDQPIYDETGKPRYHTKVVGFRPATVFDITQTDGPPLAAPPRATLLEGQAPAGLWDGLAGMVSSEGFTIQRGDCGQAKGVTDLISRTVIVRADVDDAQAVKTLAHELGHVLLHNHIGSPEARPECRGIGEVEAESVAYLVCSAAGMDTSSYSFGYVAAWLAQQPDSAALITTATRTMAAANRIINELDLLPDPMGEAAEAAAAAELTRAAPVPTAATIAERIAALQPSPVQPSLTTTYPLEPAAAATATLDRLL